MRLYEEIISLLKSSGPKMVLFFKTVCVYFVLNAHNQQGEYWTTTLKCAPIVGLIIFVLLHCTKIRTKVYYMYKILAALIFSCIGDALLDHDRFVYGMCAFASAQICYIMAFGFQPLKLWIGIPLYIFGALVVFVLSSYLEPVLLIGLPIYTILLVTMCWRAIALLFVTEKSGKITRIICALASVLFVVSDTLIAIDRFYSPISNCSVWIMATYYAAQFGISLSVVDTEISKQKKEH